MAIVTHLELIGNQFKVLYDDGTTSFAVPTMGSMWIVGGVNPAPPVDPGTGGKFMWPFNPSGVSSEYGVRDVTRFHEGIDLIPGAGSPIPASGNGVVEENYYHSNFGNLIILFHGTISGNDIRTLYAHRQTLAGPSVGSPVTKGDIIGTVGNTGASFGTHLHFETHVSNIGSGISWNRSNNGGYRTAINPRTFMDIYG